MLDGISEPHHRTASPPPPALSRVNSGRTGSLGHLCPTEYGKPPGVPQRKRSVRFEGVQSNSSHLDQLDGHANAGSYDSRTSSHSNRTTQRLEAWAAKLNIGAAPTDTVVHRSNSKRRPNVPYLSTTFDGMDSHGLVFDHRHSPPSTGSSASPFSRGANDTWSPNATASTPATSFTSPTSSSGSRKRTTLEDCQTKSGGTGEENTLAPIEEDIGRQLLIPVQENTVGVQLSIATVENAAAAKCALETLYNNVFAEPVSPRSLRKRKFEQRINDLGMTHNARMAA